VAEPAALPPDDEVAADEPGDAMAAPIRPPATPTTTKAAANTQGRHRRRPRGPA
jgi:hypothetical protein